MSDCQDVPGHMGWLNCPTHNREIMAKIEALHAKSEQTTSDQSSPHASHCSCKYEVERLQKEIDRLKEAGMAFEEDRQHQAKISMLQHDVVEAAREVRRSYQSDTSRRFMRLRIETLAAALSDHDRMLAALDKATEVRG